ncbi:hypothetical protein PI124_g10441 [Phytophthora idaei]|nr:hypothetical protein PI126_g13866 [Phytophthora idaei]KAG3244796.1 hypothetical protein PI124_g10441 [Phytophthora idaei]
MVQQVASQRVSVPPLQGIVAADPDFDLVPDLLAAAEYLSPPATTPPVAPAVSDHVDLGGLAIDELSEFLLVGLELQLELDIPWTQQTWPPSSPTPAATSAPLDSLLASPSHRPLFLRRL